MDAILVGAGTVRADNPRLVVRSAQRRALRVGRGRAESPVKVTLTRSGNLDPAAAFFTTGSGRKLVYAPTDGVADVARRLEAVATVVGAGDPLDLRAVLHDLAGRGVERLMVEGGTRVNTGFLGADLVDEAAVRPGNAGRPRVAPRGHRTCRPVFALVDLPRRCRRRWCRRRDAGHRLLRRDRSARPRGGSGAGQAGPDDPRLATATIYSSLEPCSTRASRPVSPVTEDSRSLNASSRSQFIQAGDAHQRAASHIVMLRLHRATC